MFSLDQAMEDFETVGGDTVAVVAVLGASQQTPNWVAFHQLEQNQNPNPNPGNPRLHIRVKLYMTSG